MKNRKSKHIFTFWSFRFFRWITGTPEKTPEGFKYRKPDSRHLEKTILKSGKKIEQAIMVGDSENDIICANSLNMPSIVVNFGYSNIPVEDLNANIIMSNYKDLIKHIQEVNNI